MGKALFFFICLSVYLFYLAWKHHDNYWELKTNSFGHFEVSVQFENGRRCEVSFHGNNGLVCEYDGDNPYNCEMFHKDGKSTDEIFGWSKK